MVRFVETLVIGAGPAGLTTAYKLSQSGRDVVVLEKDPVHVGGHCRTVNYKNFLFDIGGHRFSSKSSAIIALWREILPDGSVDRPRVSRMLYRNKYYAYPLRAFEALANLGLFEGALCMASFAVARLFPKGNASTFHQRARNQFGERLFSIFFKTYAEKVWGMNCDAISSDEAAQHMTGLSLGAAVDGAARPLGKKPGVGASAAATPIESFQRPRKGPGMVWEAAAAKIRDHGGDVLRGRAVQSLAYDENRKIWTVEAETTDGAREVFRAQHVVSSAPLRELMSNLTPCPLTRLHARALRYRDFLTVVLIGKSRISLPDDCVYIHDPSVKVARVRNFRSWSPEMIPDGASSCLGLEYFCSEGDELWDAPDEELVALAKREIDQIGLMDAPDVFDVAVVRQPRAYPVHDAACAMNVGAIRLELRLRYPNLHLVGRNGMHRNGSHDHAMRTGVLTAANIVGGAEIHDVWSVSDDADDQVSSAFDAAPGRLVLSKKA